MKMSIKRSLILLAMGASTFAFFGTSFNPTDLMGCNYATYGDYEAMYQAAGAATINTVSEGFFSFGTDWDTVVRVPTTNFAVQAWNNWVDARVPNDIER